MPGRDSALVTPDRSVRARRRAAELLAGVPSGDSLATDQEVADLPAGESSGGVIQVSIPTFDLTTNAMVSLATYELVQPSVAPWYVVRFKAAWIGAGTLDPSLNGPFGQLYFSPVLPGETDTALGDCSNEAAGTLGIGIDLSAAVDDTPLYYIAAPKVLGGAEKPALGAWGNPGTDYTTNNTLGVASDIRPAFTGTVDIRAGAYVEVIADDSYQDLPEGMSVRITDFSMTLIPT